MPAKGEPAKGAIQGFSNVKTLVLSVYIVELATQRYIIVVPEER
jgi:hypothetical protein